jgi:uncharacterized protein (TIGR03437 family)
MLLSSWTKRCGILVAGILAAGLGAQTNPICGPNDNVTNCNSFDSSGNAMLSGTYFVREITFAGLNAQGSSLNTAYSLTGTMTFSNSSGDGTYSFTGQELVSTVTGGAAAYTSTGSYSVSANGMLAITDPIFTSDPDLGEVGAIGPGAFIATQPGINPTILVGIPVGGTALNGTWNAGYYDFYNANVNSIRSGYFSFNSNGSGNLGTLNATGGGSDLGNIQQSVQIPSVTYSFSGQTGTINFGGSGSSQFISGTQTFEVSQDGTLMLGGSSDDYDILLAVKAAPGSATASTFSGIYFLGGFSTNVSAGQITDKAFNGSINAVAAMGLAIEHQQYLLGGATNYQNYTTDITFSVPASGIFEASDGYEYALAANGTAYVAVPTTSENFGLMLGMQPPSSISTPSSGVWLNPLGIVNSANWAPATNPVAPNEIVTLAAGSNLAPSAMSAFTPTAASPLPTTLNGVQVYVNGYAAPLLYVSPTQINMLAPTAWHPSAGWYYLTFQVYNGAYNGGTYSNAVRVFAADVAPGVFNLSGSAVGPALVLRDSDNSLITDANPAHPGDVVDIYATGLGLTVDQPITDGSVPTTTWYSPLDYLATAAVYIGGVECNVNAGSNYVGLAWSDPALSYPGLYEITVTVPSGTGSGDLPLEMVLDSLISPLNEGATVETTIAVSTAVPGVKAHTLTRQ